MENNLNQRKDFAEWLKQNRLNQGKKLKDVAKSIGISHSYLSQIEKGDRPIPKPAFLEKISEIYSIPIEDVLAKAGLLNQSTINRLDLWISNTSAVPSNSIPPSPSPGLEESLLKAQSQKKGSKEFACMEIESLLHKLEERHLECKKIIFDLAIKFRNLEEKLKNK